MDVNFDQQTHDPTPGPNYYDDLFVRTQTDLPTFNLINDLPKDLYTQGDYDPEPETDADLQDYDETFHFLILAKLPPITSYSWSQPASGLYNGSVWDCLTGKEPSEADEYWKNLQSPQSKPPRQGSEVCPSPTSLPYRPNMAPQPGNHVAMVSIKGCFVHPSWFLTTPSVS